MEEERTIDSLIIFIYKIKIKLNKRNETPEPNESDGTNEDLDERL